MKQRKKYARIGEFVKVVTPKEFVRCGYPLTIKIVMEQQFEEIEKDCVRMFAALEKKSVPVKEPEAQDDPGFFSLRLSEVTSAMSATVHGMLCSAIAAYRLEQQNYGGDTRSVVEKDGCFEAGELWKVTGKRFVKTGKRYPATYYGDDDYESGGLENAQTHCVYSVENYPHKSKILAAHCELTS